MLHAVDREVPGDGARAPWALGRRHAGKGADAGAAGGQNGVQCGRGVGGVLIDAGKIEVAQDGAVGRP